MLKEKNTGREIKTAYDKLISRPKTIEERIQDLEDIAI